MISKEDKIKAAARYKTTVQDPMGNYKSAFTTEKSALFPKKTPLQPTRTPQVTQSKPIGGKLGSRKGYTRKSFHRVY